MWQLTTTSSAVFSLGPAALAAAIAEIEKECVKVLAKATGNRDQREGRGRHLLAGRTANHAAAPGRCSWWALESVA